MLVIKKSLMIFISLTIILFIFNCKSKATTTVQRYVLSNGFFKITKQYSKGETIIFEKTNSANVAPVAKWLFDSPSGNTAIDSTGHGYDGDLRNFEGNPWSGDHPAGGSFGYTNNHSLAFDGVDDFIWADSGMSINPTSGITLQAWIKLSKLSGEDSVHQVIKKNDAWEMYEWQGNLQAWFRIGGSHEGSAFPSSLLSPNVWTHVAATYDSTTRTIKTYINGVKVSSKILSGLSSYTLDSSAWAISLGEKHGGSHFKGNMDEVQIHDVALSRTQLGYFKSAVSK